MIDSHICYSTLSCGINVDSYQRIPFQSRHKMPGGTPKYKAHHSFAAPWAHIFVDTALVTPLGGPFMYFVRIHAQRTKLLSI